MNRVAQPACLGNSVERINVSGGGQITGAVRQVEEDQLHIPDLVGKESCIGNEVGFDDVGGGTEPKGESRMGWICHEVNCPLSVRLIVVARPMVVHGSYNMA